MLNGIEFYAYGGVTEEERRIGQRYRADVVMELDLQPAMSSDAIEDTIHYGRVCELVVDAARRRPFKLIEGAAGRIVERLLEESAATRVTVRLAKLLPPIDGVVASAAVEITRSRADATSERRG
ncbi:MAG TPA: dihydroneopterin aldolase [Chloroflexota bacterium]|nr:dihydroneopterin aldolase [Chloroflexota bacterium]